MDRYREITYKDKERTELRIHRGYTCRADNTQRIHIQSRGYTEDTHTQQMIQRGCTYKAEDTHTEQRIHRGYTYKAEETQRIHIQSRGYT